ncbi:MAG: sigma 54-interacting transcriptional regulator, partial [Pyrinomonadaceae bacterium]|nr:sigma 54-interacting transcriptional regulator [Pyrinomonadaceae bacterium]
REENLRSSYRRLAVSRLPVNLYSAQARMQRRAATLLHGIKSGSSQWEELDGCQLADDLRGDRTSLLLGGTAGGVALFSEGKSGLIATAGTGTLFISHLEKMTPAAQRVLYRIIESGRYTPVGDPYPRPVSCRLIVASKRPLIEMAHAFSLGMDLAEMLGRICLRAEDVIRALEIEKVYEAHPGNLAAAS